MRLSPARDEAPPLDRGHAGRLYVWCTRRARSGFLSHPFTIEVL